MWISGQPETALNKGRRLKLLFETGEIVLRGLAHRKGALSGARCLLRVMVCQRRIDGGQVEAKRGALIDHA